MCLGRVSWIHAAAKCPYNSAIACLKGDSLNPSQTASVAARKPLFARMGVNREVAALSFARMADALGNSILVIVIPLYVAAIASPFPNLSDSVLVGILISLYGFTFSFFQPLAGAWSDRAGRRKVFIQAGLLLMTAGTLAFILASRFEELVLIRIVQGFGVALTIPASLAVMASASANSTHGGSMGFYTTLRMIGFSAGPLLGGFLQVHFGFRVAFLTGAAFLLLGYMLVQVWVDEPPGETSPSGALRLFDRTLMTRPLLFLALATFFMASAFSMMAPLENEFNIRLGQSAVGFGVAFGALTVARLLFQLPLGRLSDRIGRRPLIIVGLVMLAPVTALIGFAMTTLQLTGLRALQGVATAAIAAPAFAMAADLSRPGTEGQQMSILAMGFGLGIAVGPLLAGLLAVIAFELPFIIGGAMALIGAWIVHRFVPETLLRLG